MLTSYFMLILCARSVVLFRTSTCLRDNEEFSLCGWRCPATCVNLRFLPTDLCPSTWDCRVGCRCAAGFVRDEYSKQCVLVQDCPGNISSSTSNKSLEQFLHNVRPGSR
ncbi:hypothetical protein B5X24_HaOG212179 [Helicoverpa armigera]|nr:hypothetical protein B5X24_HaOG212179 [Helicoverpa armigera]